MRRRFILLKDAPCLKKGAIFEEMCDDGTQNFTLITPKSDKFPDGRGWLISRDSIINNPKWWGEVDLLWLSKEQIKKVKKILRLK